MITMNLQPDQHMKTQATKLYPFVPSGRYSTCDRVLSRSGVRGAVRTMALRTCSWGADFLLQDIDVPECKRTR